MIASPSEVSLTPEKSDYEEDLEYWYNLPYEERKWVLENMNTEMKLVYFSGSPDFLMDIPEDFFKSVKFVRSALILETTNDSHDILLDFRTTEDGIKVSASRDLFNTVIWHRIEPGDITEVVGKYFQIVISRTIKLQRIVINSALFPFDATSIRHLNNLDEVEINNEYPIDLIECGFIEFEQLRRIEKSIKFNGLPLTMLQLQQLKAEKLQFESMRNTSKEINKHLKMYLNDQLQNITFEMELFMAHDHKLNMRKLTRGLKPLGITESYEGTSFVLISKDESRIVTVLMDSRYFRVNLFSRTSFLDNQKYLPFHYSYAVFDYLIGNPPYS